MVLILNVKQGRDLVGFKHPGGLDEVVVELLILGELDDLGDELQRAAALLDSNHKLVAMDKAAFVNQVLVNVSLRHAVDYKGTIEILLMSEIYT